MLRIHAAVALTAFMGVATTAQAQKPRGRTVDVEKGTEARGRAAAPEPPAATGTSPSYGGVTLLGGDPPESKPPSAGLVAVTWPGFRVARGASEVFLQLTGPVTHKEKVKGQRLLITLDKAEVPLRNNLRPVITRDFTRTPVSAFRLRRLAKDQVRLEITLRRKSPHTVNVKTQGRYNFLVVSFPASAAAAAPAPEQ
jgi:hypothetical protein